MTPIVTQTSNPLTAGLYADYGGVLYHGDRRLRPAGRVQPFEGSAICSNHHPAASQPNCSASGGKLRHHAGCVLKNRKSTNAFQTQPLPKEVLLDLLWAAWGINRPESGKRTAPSAMNTQEIDLYVLLADGAYMYDAKQNQLTQVSDQDLRAQMGAMRFQNAPVQLVFVADYAKYKAGTRSEQETWSAAHTGLSVRMCTCIAPPKGWALIFMWAGTGLPER